MIPSRCQVNQTNGTEKAANSEIHYPAVKTQSHPEWDFFRPQFIHSDFFISSCEKDSACLPAHMGIGRNQWDELGSIGIKRESITTPCNTNAPKKNRLLNQVTQIKLFSSPSQGRFFINKTRDLKMTIEINYESLHRKEDWWKANEEKYGRFFGLGQRSFDIFTKHHRRHLKAAGALVKNGMGVFVNDPIMHIEIQKKILGKK